MSRWPRLVIRWPRAFADALWPSACAACRCPARGLFCDLCAAEVAPAPPLHVLGATSAWAGFGYEGPVASALRVAKYGLRSDLAVRIGRALGARWPGPLAPARSVVAPAAGSEAPRNRRFSRWPCSGAIAIPMPPAPHRLRRRGFNPAERIARGLGVPVRTDWLRRLDRGRPQASLPRDRRLSATMSFSAVGPVSAQRLVLVDDVVATGRTASLAIGALRRAGAIEITFLAAAAVSEDGPTQLLGAPAEDLGDGELESGPRSGRHGDG